MDLENFDILVLKEISNFKENNGWMAPREIELKFGDNEYEEQVKDSTLKLMSLKLIKGHGSPDPDGTHGVYSITPQGNNFLEERSTSARIGSVVNSNIAINSSNVVQQLNIEDSDIKEKITELEGAMKEKNSFKIKQIFGYITDKAVDVAIQILLKGMIGC